MYKSISIIVPCYNEEESIPYLKEKLIPVWDNLKKKYSIEVLFIDDGSKDQTLKLLHSTFGSKKGTKIIKHHKNMNLGAAVRTGIKNSTGDIVCAIDSDCSFDPIILKGMIKKIGSNADIVSAAAHHPKGGFSAKVPGYRLFLSKSIGEIYNILLLRFGKRKQYSYNGLVRAYKGKLIRKIRFKSNNFLAMTEIMVKALLKGCTVYEYPAVNNFRKFGESKIRLFGVIKSHIFFVLKLASHRLFRTRL